MAPDPRAVAQLVAGMAECLIEDIPGGADDVAHLAADCGPGCDAAALVDAAMWVAGHMLWLAATDAAEAADRSRRWRASVERIALQVDGLRRREGA